MPGHQNRKVHRRSSHGAFGLSLILHCLFLGCVITMSLCPSSAPLAVKKLLVSSIHLQPQKISTQTQATLPKASESPSLSLPKEVPAEKEALSEPVAEKIQKSEEVAATETPETPPSKESRPKPTAMQPSKSSKTPTKSTPSKSTKKPTVSAAKKSASGQSKNTGVDPKLLQKVLKSLNQSKAYGEGMQKGSGQGNQKGEMRRAGSVGSLAVDHGVAVEGLRDDFLENGYGESSPEACYISDLIRRLQLNVRLPEPGEVKLKLTLKRNGSMTNIAFISCQKESTKKAIKEKISSILFAPFGGSFSSENEHTFMLRLTHDLVWSCGS